MKILFGLPIIEPIGYDHGHVDLQKKCLEDLCSASDRIQIGDDYLGFVFPKIDLLNSPTLFPRIKSFWTRPKILRNFRLLTITIDCHLGFIKVISDIKSSDIPINDKVKSDKEKRRLAVELVASGFGMHINNLLLVSNIIYPGAISYTKGFVLYKKKKIAEIDPFYAENLFEVIEVSKKIKWPKFYKVSIKKAWDWFINSKCVSDGIGKRSLGRAWAALSHVTTDSIKENSAFNLILILLGLEALYGEGNVELKKQLASKTEILLGKREENKKAFGATYDFRSRFLHGDIDFPLRYTKFDGVQEYEKFHNELYEHEAVALAALISTIQLMASRGWFELNFEYKVSGHKIKPPEN